MLFRSAFVLPRDTRTVRFVSSVRPPLVSVPVMLPTSSVTDVIDGAPGAVRSNVTFDQVAVPPPVVGKLCAAEGAVVVLTANGTAVELVPLVVAGVVSLAVPVPAPEVP